MNNNLDNITKAINEIAIALSRDSSLCALLTDDTPEALNHGVIVNDWTTLIDKQYINLYPPVIDSINKISVNTYVVLLLDGVDFANDNNLAEGDLYITTDEAHILLSQYKNRLIEASNIIIKILNSLKLTCAGAIRVVSMSHVMISEWRAGYRIHFRFTDQTIDNRKSEI